MNDLLTRIEERNAHVCVVGLGYVGLPLAVAFAEAGFRVTGFDVDSNKVEAINRGESYIPDIATDRLQAQTSSDRLDATTEAAILGRVDTVHICVPTPLGKTREPDISYVVSAGDEVAQHLHAGMLVVLESTTYPGTTEEILAPRLAEGGLELGSDYHLAFSPERIDPGNAEFTLENTPKVMGGMTAECTRVAAAMYGTIVGQVHEVSSPAAAELVKLLENTFRSVNIGLANEMALMCDRMGIDTWEVIQAAATKPFGFMPFFPGPGLGGHCIPVDPHYLTWKARTLNYQARLIEVAAEINAAMPEHVVAKVAAALNDHEKSVRGSRVLMIGVAYKRDVDDTRESPAIDVMRMLQDRGAVVEYADPFVPELTVQHGVVADQKAVTGLPQVCANYDCVVVGTDHTDIDWPGVVTASELVVDTRNVASGLSGDNVVRI
ncbi:MAG: nucleotide sugar dehydrogenase [Acidobacteria bacterium]|nr:nucleotide sugar dehydrogenase [Acidobacteriota bacterium]